MNFSLAILTFTMFIIFATFHEYAHGWMAYRLGDSTAKRSGRLSLNPLVHIDPVWTILMPIMLLLSSGGTRAFGSAKPVPVNPYWLRNPKRDMMWVGLAGPVTNILWALGLIIIMKAGLNTGLLMPGSRIYLRGVPYFFLFMAMQINIVLLVFNMLPIPPLDGSRVIEGLLPDKYADEYARIKPYGFIIIIMLLSMGWIDQRLNILGRLLSFAIDLVVNIFGLL
jgi:Zn-dependent protease